MENGKLGPESQIHSGAGLTQGARRATEVTPALADPAGALGPGQRWSVGRTRDVVLRLLRGEPVEALSRELGVEVYRPEEWKAKALAGMEASLRERGGDPLERDLDAARKKIGEVSMENEWLRTRSRGGSPLRQGRLRNWAQRSPRQRARRMVSSRSARFGSRPSRASTPGSSLEQMDKVMGRRRPKLVSKEPAALHRSGYDHRGQERVPGSARKSRLHLYPPGDCF
jgi:hypothetical protein